MKIKWGDDEERDGERVGRRESKSHDGGELNYHSSVACNCLLLLHSLKFRVVGDFAFEAS